MCVVGFWKTTRKLAHWACCCQASTGNDTHLPCLPAPTLTYACHHGFGWSGKGCHTPACPYLLPPLPPHHHHTPGMPWHGSGQSLPPHTSLHRKTPTYQNCREGSILVRLNHGHSFTNCRGGWGTSPYNFPFIASN